MNYIFDLDETLVENSEIAPEIVKEVAVSIMKRKKEPGLTGTGFHRVEQRYAKYHGTKTRKYLDDGKIQLAPGVKDFLSTRDGYMAGLTNSTHRSAELKLEKLGLDRFLEITLTPRDIARKPSPEGINSIIKKSGLEKKDFTFVGNAITDIMAGKRAGVKTITISRDPLNIFLADEAYSSFQAFAENH